MKRALLLSLLVACGGGMAQGAAFNDRWFDDEGAAVKKLRARWSDPAPVGAAVAVGVVGDKKLVGIPLEGAGKPWSYSHALSDRPALAGQTVVAFGDGELFGLDARTGKELWKLKAPAAHLRGAGDDGKLTVVSMAPSHKHGSVVLAIRRDGSILRQIEDAAEIGVPAVVGRFAFLPWQRQYVTIYDLEDGREEARVLVRSLTSRAFAVGGSVFFGEVGATRWDEKTHLSSKKAASFVSLPLAGLPGEPKWMRSGIDPVDTTWAAYDKIAILARPDGDRVVDGRFAATYYRIVVARSSVRGELLWVHTAPHDVLAGAQHPGGFVLCEEDGTVAFVDGESGEKNGSVSLGERLDACLVSADGITRRGHARKRSLAAQLDEAVTAGDARLVTAQKKLLAELGALSDGEATKTLIRIADDPHATPDILEAARALLAGRRAGSEHMLASLGRRYDFLANELRPPPVGPIAEALAAMDEKGGAPLLAKHLLDPATPTADVVKAAAALEKLAGPGEKAALERFFAFYRGGLPEPELKPAIVSVAAALVRLGSQDLVLAAKKDAFTAEDVRAALP